MTGLFQPGPVLAAMLRHKTGPLTGGFASGAESGDSV
jgi:hypothetical protein